MGKPSTEIDVIHALLEMQGVIEPVPAGHDDYMEWAYNNEDYVGRVMAVLPDLLILADDCGTGNPEATFAYERLRNWAGKKALKRQWIVVEDKNIFEDGRDYKLACYSTDSYEDVDAAIRSGGLYEIPSVMHGCTQVWDCLEGMKIAEDCMDGNHPLVIVYKEV